MNIVINCRSFSKAQNTGIGRYTFNLVENLSHIDRTNRYYLYLKKNLLSPRRIPKIKAANFSAKNDYFNLGPAKRLKDFDIYHAPSPEILPDCSAKIIVTVHDVIFKAYPAGHTSETIAQARRQFKDIVDKARIIICISRTTQSDMQKYFGIDGRRLRLIYPGVNKEVFRRLKGEEIPKAQNIIRARRIDGPFILSVGTMEPRKNLEGTIRAFAALKAARRFPGKLAVIGMAGWKESSVFDLVEHLRLKDDVVFLGFLSDEELVSFYNLAEVFVFPSFYEGFGFPVVEAFCCGAAVVTSHVSSCAEMAWDAALTVDPRNPDAIAEAMGRILKDEDLKKELQQKGLERAGYFSFLKTAQETLEIYKEVYQN